MTPSLICGIGPLGYAMGTPQPEPAATATERTPEERSHHVTPLQTKAQQVKARFADQGIPVSQWADAHGYRRSDVYRVLNGFTACRRGVPHEIAVKLGLKPDPSKTPA